MPPHNEGIQTEIERRLAYLKGEYEWAVQAHARWDEDELASFVAEQPLRDETFADLAAYADLGRLAPDQRRTFDQLTSFIEQHRAAIDAILAR